MAEKSYILSTNDTIQDDLKIFLGTDREIRDIELNKRVVNRKWYFAWDTGRIYYGNAKQRLIQFGGSQNGLTEDDAKKLIESYTKADLIFMKSQLVNISKEYAEMKYNIQKLSAEIQETIDKLNRETLAYITEQVDKVLQSAEDLTYSKGQIDDKLDELNNNISDNYISNLELETELRNYVSKDFTIDNIIQYSTGDNLLVHLANKTRGYYFCITDSSDINYTFERGHTYYINNGSFTDVTAQGTGGTVQNPTISLLIDGLSSSSLIVGESFVKHAHITYTLSNIRDMRGTLIFYENQQQVRSGLPLTNNSFYVDTTLTDLRKGHYTYTLVGQDKNSNPIIGTYNLNVIAPIYYGGASNNIPEESVIKSFNTKLSESVSGTYNITINQNQFVWILIPSDNNINSFTLNGFTAPFNEPILLTLNFGNVTQEYKAYRSYSSLQAGTINLNIN